MILYLLMGLGTVLWLVYKYLVAVYRKWDEMGIPSVAGRFPYGSSSDFSYFKSYQGHLLDEGYRKFPDSPYFGMYMMRIPFLVIRDPAIVQLVLTKEFSHFRDRQGYRFSEHDFLSHHLFNLDGERWRALRVKTSPTFSSGKLKGMFPLFLRCAEDLDNLLFSNLGNTVNINDLVARFTTDVITSCAFGLETNSIQDSENEFRKMGKSLGQTSQKDVFSAIVLRMFPFLNRIFVFKFNSKKMEDFLLKVVKSSVEYREKTGLVRNDFMDLLIQLKNNKGVLKDDTLDDKDVQPLEMTLELMAAQCFVFFLAGFETSSSVQSSCFYELAHHPEMQERLRNEVDNTLAKHGTLTYQAVQEMEYLDMVVSETMRKYPTLWSLKRNCTKTFTTPAGHVLEKGTRVLVPIWSLHHDPNFFPKPDEFNPERFSPENKHSITPYSYLPFGEGPRICIGMRFGLLQTKVGIITMLKKYKLELSPKTISAIEYNASFEISTAKHPIYLQLKKRP